MLLSFVLPETLMAVALLFVITQVATPLTPGTTAQVVGLVTFQLSYPVVIVRARLLTIGKQYEEAAVDLGASPIGAVRRVLLPMLVPAIFASTVLVFADVIDDFVIVRYLSGDSSTEPVSVKIYNTARAAPDAGAERARHAAAGLLVGRDPARLPRLSPADPRRGLGHARHRRLRRRALTRPPRPAWRKCLERRYAN